MKVYAYDRKKNKRFIVGEIINKTFYKPVTEKHYMRAQMGYGIQEDAFKILIEQGVKFIQIEIDVDNFITAIETWYEFGVLADYGHGLQRFLKMAFMRSPAKVDELINIDKFKKKPSSQNELF